MKPSVSVWGLTERRVIVSLAGSIGERRTVEPDSLGWRRVVSRAQSTCIHEAAHAVVARALGWHVYELNLDPDPSLRDQTGAPVMAYASTGRKPERSKAPPDGVINSDRRTAALLCFARAGDWKGAVRLIHEFRAAAADLIERNWLMVTCLASELEFHRRLDQGHIARILGGAK